MIWTICWAGVAAILFACLVGCVRAFEYQCRLSDLRASFANITRENLSLCIAALIEIRNSEHAEGKVPAAIARQTLREIALGVECEKCKGEGEVYCSNPDCFDGYQRDGSCCPQCGGTSIQQCPDCNGEGEC